MTQAKLLELLTFRIVFENALQGTRSDFASAFLHIDHTELQFAVNAVAVGSCSDDKKHRLAKELVTASKQ